MMVRPFRLFVLSLLLPVLLTACGNDRPIPGEIKLNSMFQAEFDLIDQDGNPAPDERFEGKPMLIYYGFTSCPEICPAALRIMEQSIERLGKDADKVQFVFITVDPQRDDPERLKNHLAHMGGIIGLTGSQEAITASVDAMNVYASKVELPDSAFGYTMDHSRLFYVIDEKGKPLIAMPDSTPPEMVVKILRRYL